METVILIILICLAIPIAGMAVYLVVSAIWLGGLSTVYIFVRFCEFLSKQSTLSAIWKIIKFLWELAGKILFVGGGVIKDVSGFGGRLIEKKMDVEAELKKMEFQRQQELTKTEKQKKEDDVKMVEEVFDAWQKAQEGDFKNLFIVKEKYGEEVILKFIKEFKIFKNC